MELRVEDSGKAYIVWVNVTDEYIGTFGPEDEDHYRVLEPSDGFWKIWHNNRHQLRDLLQFQVIKLHPSRDDWVVARYFPSDTYRAGPNDESEWMQKRKLECESNGYFVFRFVENEGWQVTLGDYILRERYTLERAVSYAEFMIYRRSQDAGAV